MNPAQTGVEFTNTLSTLILISNKNLLNGSGVAMGDYDNDGHCDIYLCRLDGSNVMYQNLGNWKFEDTTAATGTGCPSQFSSGATFADVDGDHDGIDDDGHSFDKDDYVATDDAGGNVPARR